VPIFNIFLFYTVSIPFIHSPIVLNQLAKACELLSLNIKELEKEEVEEERKENSIKWAKW
jgi:hypothetical protein